MCNADFGQRQQVRTIRQARSSRNAKNGSRGNAPCRVKGQRPLWGLGQRPNCSAGDQYAKRAQQRCRQRSVPASNFARPQTRPQAALSTTCTLSRQMGATDLLVFPTIADLSRKQGFRLCGGDQRAVRTDEVCDRPLETFGSPLPELTLIAACENGNIRKTRNIF